MSVRGRSSHGWPHYLVAAVLLALVWGLSSPASAGYRQGCYVKFKSIVRDVIDDELAITGWSGLYPVVCSYWTGMELNDASDSDRYQRSRTYVLFSLGGQQFVRIGETTGCLFEADPNCAEAVSRSLRGRDEDVSYGNGREIRRDWIICQPGLSRRDCHLLY